MPGTINIEFWRCTLLLYHQIQKAVILGCSLWYFLRVEILLETSDQSYEDSMKHIYENTKMILYTSIFGLRERKHDNY